MKEKKGVAHRFALPASPSIAHNRVHGRPTHLLCVGADGAGQCLRGWGSDDRATPRYARGRGLYGVRRERGCPLRSHGGVDDRPRVALVDVPPRSAGVLPRDSGHAHGPGRVAPDRAPCRVRRGPGVRGGRSIVHGHLFLSCHGPCPYPCLGLHDRRVRDLHDGPGEKSGDAQIHHGDGESVL